jgi:tRNA pseudouridine38-40 synthase
MSFQRAARTDKGVSAIGNLLSLKMELAEDTLQKLNDILPKQIRVFGIF